MNKQRKVHYKVADNPSRQLWTFKWFEGYGWKPWKTDRDYDFPLFNNYWLAYAAALKWNQRKPL
jgi:hypothetical protein